MSAGNCKTTGWVWLLGAALWTSAATAAPVTLYDLNASVTIEPNSSSGMYGWYVDGVRHLSQQWFWYRIGDTGPEEPIHLLGDLEVKLSDADMDPGIETAALKYVSSLLEVQMLFTLNGGEPGSRTSDIAESITIKNLSGRSLELHLFQYCDFDLNDTWYDASVSITGGNTARQTDEGPVYASETVITPAPSRYQADYYNTILASLSDGNATTLSNQAGPVGPGDLTWAFQWTFVLDPDGGVTISKDKSVVPEPASAGLLVAGGALLGLLRRRRAR